jgi:hypothetical protein
MNLVIKFVRFVTFELVPMTHSYTSRPLLQRKRRSKGMGSLVGLATLVAMVSYDERYDQAQALDITWRYRD